MGRLPRPPILREKGAAPQLVEVTSRVIHGRFLLRPAPRLNDLALGILARAANRYEVKVFTFAFLSNHYHLIVAPDSAQALAAFVGYLNANLAREAGRLYGWKEKIWGRRYQAIPISDEPEAQIARLRYCLSQGTKEHLVASPLDWPGAHCVRSLLDGSPVRGRWHNRTKEYRARLRGKDVAPDEFLEETAFELSVLPALVHLSARDRQERLADLVKQIETDASIERLRLGIKPLGAAAVLRQHPHSAPKTLETRPAPLVHAWSREVGRKMRESFRLFLDAYRGASARLRAGLQAHFPEGCFPPALPFVAVRAG